jgi:pimeloyl-ACP methyl ester carboxylesterase
MDLFAEDLDAFLDALQVAERLVVCGLSMGGYVAFAFYRKYAHRLRGLILTSTRAAPDTPQGKALRDQAAELARSQGVGPVVDAMVSKLISPASQENQPQLAADVLALMSRTSPSGMIGALMAMKERADSTPTLGRIDIPTLVIHGADDSIVPLAEANEMTAAIPGARLEVIPGAGHLPNMENPRAYNKAVRRFLASLG